MTACGINVLSRWGLAGCVGGQPKGISEDMYAGEGGNEERISECRDLQDVAQ